ncbi:MAG: flagellar motor switch protein FliG [Limnobacter sp. CACIAM 66H1]|jgi:flagellar motor switch protein FliG|uniref:flagellar motor switch protein FliG n=1 Tax=unclassified Limnobacter TaxID=2630203 RepID=UPI0007A850ED|nr:flagellar motor switch protein FliG [Limnobacter sp. CACIAM 66H1]KYP11829.1 MAG: flagellar motor switch protein FliG [Limnobacter sp. CACIAM 66H1]
MAESELGIQKGAILMLSLGEEEAAEVFKYLGPKEVQRLGQQMSKTKDVPIERIEEIAGEVVNLAQSQSALGLDSDAYIRSVLTKALGEDKAGFLLDRILQGSDTSGIEGLKWMDPATVAELIKNEHPQIIATILVHLERDFAAAILNLFVDRLRSDVVLRIATIDGIQPNALLELNDVLSKVLAGGDKLKKTTLGGVRAAAEILNFVGTTSEKTVLDTIREYDNELSQRIQDEMFTFDNLLDIDDRGMQSILRDVQTDLLVIALKGADEAIREKVFKNMSSRAAEALRDDLESRGPVRLSEVEAAQKDVLKVARKLADAGEVVLGGGGEDAFI